MRRLSGHLLLALAVSLLALPVHELAIAQAPPRAPTVAPALEPPLEPDSLTPPQETP